MELKPNHEESLADLYKKVSELNRKLGTKSVSTGMKEEFFLLRWSLIKSFTVLAVILLVLQFVSVFFSAQKPCNPNYESNTKSVLSV